MNIASVSANSGDLSPIPSVCLGPESVLWQNGWMDPDAVWGGECGRSRVGVTEGMVIVEGEGAVLWVNLGRPIVTDGYVVA